MTWSKNTGAGYHQQDTSYYCGAAVAQMILDSIGAGLLDQDVLYNSNHSHNTQAGWYTDPNGLSYTLDHFKPANFNNIFPVFTMDTERDGSQKIVYTLWHYGVATGTLVEGCGHWIVVRGVSTDVEPVLGSTYTINGFWVNNPWPPVPTPANPPPPPPPPHAVGDGCGTGGDRGIANEYAAYDTTWKDTYFTGCDVWGVGHPQFVSVCDPEMPKLGALTMRRREFPARGDRILTERQAIEFSSAGLEQHGVARDNAFGRALRGARPGRPVLVQRLDLPDTFYYLVPMATNAGVTAWVSVDALYGSFRGAHALPSPAKHPFVEREAVIKTLLKKPLDLGEQLGRVVIREGAFCFFPLMVWRPCEESRSPYYPFFMITVGSRQLYIGYDGTIYPELHDLVPGG